MQLAQPQGVPKLVFGRPLRPNPGSPAAGWKPRPMIAGALEGLIELGKQKTDPGEFESMMAMFQATQPERHFIKALAELETTEHGTNEQGPYADKGGKVAELAGEIEARVDGNDLAAVSYAMVDLLRPVNAAQGHVHSEATFPVQFWLSETLLRHRPAVMTAGEIAASELTEIAVGGVPTGIEAIPVRSGFELFTLAVGVLRRLGYFAYIGQAASVATGGTDDVAVYPVIGFVDRAQVLVFDPTNNFIHGAPPIGMDVFTEAVVSSYQYGFHAADLARKLRFDAEDAIRGILAGVGASHLIRMVEAGTMLPMPVAVPHPPGYEIVPTRLGFLDVLYDGAGMVLTGNQIINEGQRRGIQQRYGQWEDAQGVGRRIRYIADAILESKRLAPDCWDHGMDMLTQAQMEIGQALPPHHAMMLQQIVTAKGVVTTKGGIVEMTVPTGGATPSSDPSPEPEKKSGWLAKIFQK